MYNLGETDMSNVAVALDTPSHVSVSSSRYIVMYLGFQYVHHLFRLSELSSTCSS